MKLALLVLSALSSAHAWLLHAAPNAHSQRLAACSRSSAAMQFDFFGNKKKDKQWTADQKQAARSSLYGDVDAEQSTPTWGWAQQKAPAPSPPPAPTPSTVYEAEVYDYEEEEEESYEEEAPANPFKSPLQGMFENWLDQQKAAAASDDDEEGQAPANPFAGFQLPKNPFDNQ